MNTAYDKETSDKETRAIEIANKRWNAIHHYYDRNQIKYDDWLKQFKEYIDNCKSPIIDLGCGNGNDTLYLIEQGKQVISCDYSENAIKNIQNNFPEVFEAKCFDMTKGLPFVDDYSELIISDLSLHYFTEEKTYKILEEIKRVLKHSGILLFRVNSVHDTNYGAGEGKEIEKHLYETDDGRYKRFFDQDDLNRFFLDWEIIYLNEESMDRYKQNKILWKGAVRAKQ